MKEVAGTLSRAAEAMLNWAEENWVAFDKAKAEAMFLSKRQRKPTEPVRVGDYEVQFNQRAVARNLDRLQNAPQKHHFARKKKARNAMHCIRRLAGRLGMCPDAGRRALEQYGAELWWDDRKGSPVKNRCDEFQKLENQLGRTITGNFRTTNLAVVMAELG